MPSTSADDRNAGVVPLVINTQGWVKGLGMDLLVRIEQEAEVTDVFEFEAASGGPGDEWEDGGWEASIPLEGGWGRIWSGADGGLDDPYRQSSRAGPRRHFLSPVGGTPLAARWTASDLRLLSLITYFHAQFPTPLFSDPMSADASPLAESWHFDLPLVAHRPWAVDWTKAFTAVYLAGAGAEDIIPSLVWDALAISLVALVAPDDDSPVAGRPIEPHSAVPYEQGRPPPEPASSRCLGLAIVRATPGLAPSHDKTVHLLTPLPARLLSQTTLLVKGETELPLAAMLDWRVDADFIGGIGGVERENVPYIEWVGKDGGVGVIGGGRRKVRRNVGRRQG
jgi:polynucleotide 5'-hydroxyl-kinase GRC3/NOL9